MCRTRLWMLRLILNGLLLHSNYLLLYLHCLMPVFRRSGLLCYPDISLFLHLLIPFRLILSMLIRYLHLLLPRSRQVSYPVHYLSQMYYLISGSGRLSDLIYLSALYLLRLLPDSRRLNLSSLNMYLMNLMTVFRYSGLSLHVRLTIHLHPLLFHRHSN